MNAENIDKTIIEEIITGIKLNDVLDEFVKEEIEVNEETREPLTIFVCSLCGKKVARKRETIITHIKKEHFDTDDFKVRFVIQKRKMFDKRVEDVKQELLKGIKNSYCRIMNEFDVYKTHKENFVKRFNEFEFGATNAIEWNAGPLSFQEGKVKIARNVKIIMNKNLPDNEKFGLILKFVERTKNELIGNPPRNSSTSIFHNAIELSMFNGMCSMFDSFSYLMMMTSYIKDYFNIEEYQNGNK